MRENNIGYSDDWQPYTGDYDKFEYDIKLIDGTVVENCYPNAGEFNSISDKHNNQSFKEELIKWLEEYRMNLMSLMGQDYYVTGKLDVIKDVLKKLNQSKDV